MEPIPAILSPVSRCIEVADLARSIYFYRDVLGFGIGQTGEHMEAVSGPARIQLIAPGRGDGHIGSAVLFFQTEDVTAMRTAIRRRGGISSTLEDVNWIKMRMFEVRDPDGHRLWFGQSFDQPVAPKPDPKLCQALPELPFDNVEAAIKYYCKVLGFKINYSQHDLGVLYRDEVTILLIARTPRHTGIGSFEVYVADADGLYDEFRTAGAKLQGAPVSQPWGLRTFQLLDLEGNRLTFAQPFE